jgi:hypothetical protein
MVASEHRRSAPKESREMIDDLIIEGGPVEAMLTASSNIPMPDRIIISTPSETKQFVPRDTIAALVEENRRLREVCELVYLKQWPHAIYDVLVKKHFDLAEQFAEFMHDIHAALDGGE